MKAYQSKKDLVVEAIREAILLGELEPGERLLQDDVAGRLNVSATPVREALRQLETEGALEYSPNKGVRVATADLPAVNEVYLIRAELEALATRLAVARLPAAKIEQLKSIHRRIVEHTDKGNLRQLRQLNFELHMLIYEAAGMPLLLKLIESLWTKFPWDTLHVVPGRAAVASAEHKSLIEAIEAKDEVLAGQRLHAHIASGASALNDCLAVSKAKRVHPGPNKKKLVERRRS